MENMNRRHFIGSVSALAAGAVAGIPTENIRISETLVEFKAYLFAKEPIVIKGSVHADKAKDIFRIRTFDDKGHQIAEVHMPLARIKTLLRTSEAQCFQAMCRAEDGKVSYLGLTAGIENEKFILQACSLNAPPFWTQVEDVRRVV